MKHCSKCGEIKPLSEFYRNARSKDGYRHHCKSCVRCYRNADSERTASQAWVDRNPKAAMLRAARHRAKMRGLEFDLTVDDFDIPDRCPVFGMRLMRGRNRTRCEASATLDRIDNNRGYIRGNVIVVSWKANCLKRNFTVEDIRRVAEFYENLVATLNIPKSSREDSPRIV